MVTEMFAHFVRQEKKGGQRNKMNKILPKCQKSNDFIFSFFSSSFNCWTFFFFILYYALMLCFFFLLFLWYVINRSFIFGKLEQTIRIVHMQYSVHTIKIKEIQNLYKTKHWRKKSYNLRYIVGKPSALLIIVCTLYPTGLIALTKIIQTFY